jgi:hypothetical protein
VLVLLKRGEPDKRRQAPEDVGESDGANDGSKAVGYSEALADVMGESDGADDGWEVAGFSEALGADVVGESDGANDGPEVVRFAEALEDVGE